MSNEQQGREQFLREIADTNNELAGSLGGGCFIVNPTTLHVGGEPFTAGSRPPLGEGEIKWSISSRAVSVDDVRAILAEQGVDW